MIYSTLMMVIGVYGHGVEKYMDNTKLHLFPNIS